MPFILREAVAEDVPALAALHVQAFNETHTRGGGSGPTYELRERQWRDAFCSWTRPLDTPAARTTV